MEEQRLFDDDQMPNGRLRDLSIPVYKQTPECVQFVPNVHHTEKDRLLTNSYHKSSDLHHQLSTDEFSRISKKNDKEKPKSGVISFQPQHQGIGLLSYSRLVIPTKSDIVASSASDIEPLVIIEMDESSDEEFLHPSLPHRIPRRDITQHLTRDGYNLDLQPDDNDLDLILPKSTKRRCACCSSSFGCGIQ